MRRGVQVNMRGHDDFRESGEIRGEMTLVNMRGHDDSWERSKERS